MKSIMPIELMSIVTLALTATVTNAFAFGIFLFEPTIKQTLMLPQIPHSNHKATTLHRAPIARQIVPQVGQLATTS